MVFHVVKIVFQLFNRLLHAGAIGIAHLCPAGQAGLDAVPNRVKRDLLRQYGDEFRPFRARPDEAHFSSQNVDQLRKLVDSAAPYETPNPGDSVVID